MRTVIRRARRACGSAVALALLAAAEGWTGPASAEDAPPPPLAPFLERVIPQLKEERQELPPFLRDADLTGRDDKVIQ